MTASWRKWTVRLLIFVVLFLGGYDLLAYQFAGQDATITQVIRDNSAEWLLIPVLAGLLYGHLFWGGDTNKGK